jgi:hypothetical protein
MDPISTGFIALGAKQAALFEQNRTAYLNVLVTCGSQRAVLYSVYGVLVASKRLLSLEQQPEAIRREFWEVAKEKAAGRLDRDKTAFLAKCLYCLFFYLNTEN